jgi:hypothetical protein
MKSTVLDPGGTLALSVSDVPVQGLPFVSTGRQHGASAARSRR